MKDRIEYEVTINASLDRVWELVTRPGWWVPNEVEATVDRTPGHETVRESATWGRFPVQVVAIDPQSYAAFRWASQFPGAELTPGKTTLVEFFVAAVAAGVRVTVVESGFATMEAPETVRRSRFNENAEGWRLELGGLKDRAEEALGA